MRWTSLESGTALFESAKRNGAAREDNAGMPNARRDPFEGRDLGKRIDANGRAEHLAEVYSLPRKR